MNDLKFNDAVRIARGCFDYGGGHRDRDREIFHHGIQTVVNALEATEKSGLTGLQEIMLHAIGKNPPTPSAR